MESKEIFILTNPFQFDNYRAAFILHELSQSYHLARRVIKESQI
jgi:hypothetical protein